MEKSTEKAGSTYAPLFNCSGVFQDMNEEFGEREKQALKNGRCVDTKAETAFIKGTKVF